VSFSVVTSKAQEIVTEGPPSQNLFLNDYYGRSGVNQCVAELKNWCMYSFKFYLSLLL